MNATKLRLDLSEVYTQLRNRKIPHKDADCLANVAGKMIATAKLQLEYAKLRKEKPDIEFLKDGDDQSK